MDTQSEFINDEQGGLYYIAKKVAIQDLPDCSLKTELLEIVRDPATTIPVVGKPGQAGDWAAYHGIPLLDQIKGRYQGMLLPQTMLMLHTPAGVVANGDKIDQDVANLLFPEFSELRYRR